MYISNFLEELRLLLENKFSSDDINDSSELNLSFTEELSDLVFAFNTDKTKQDKAVLTEQELLKTKEKILENFDLLMERGDKLENLLIKTEDIQVGTLKYRKRATQYNTMQRHRGWKMFGCSLFALIIIAVAAFLVFTFLI